MPAVPNKDVSISVSNKTITVVVTFSSTPGYNPVVTVTRVPNGSTDTLTGTPIPGGFKFEDTVQAGKYVVEVVCSEKRFGDTVDVPANPDTEVSFKFKKVK